MDPFVSTIEGEVISDFLDNFGIVALLVVS